MPDCEATVRLAQSPDVDPVSEDVRSGIGLPRAGGGGLARDDACLDPQQSGRREAHAPRPPTPPDIRVSYPAVLLGVVALDTSAPGLDSPPTPTALATPLWAQIGFRPLRLPRGAPRQPELVRHAFLRLHTRRVIRVCSQHQEVQPFPPARPGPVLWRLLTPPCPSSAIADAVVRINRTGPEASQGKPCLFPAVPPDLPPPRPGSFRASPSDAGSPPRSLAFYPVPVRRGRVSPPASFRFRLATDTLALGYTVRCYLRPLETLTPDTGHAWHTSGRRGARAPRPPPPPDVRVRIRRFSSVF